MSDKDTDIAIIQATVLELLKDKSRKKELVEALKPLVLEVLESSTRRLPQKRDFQKALREILVERD